MAYQRILFLFCLTIVHLTLPVKSDCRISVKNGMHDVYPPIVISTDKPYDQIYPNVNQDRHNIVIKEGKSFYAICPSNTINSNSEVNKLKGSTLKYDNQATLNPMQIKCDQSKLKSAGKLTGIDFKKLSCDGGGPILRLVKPTKLCANGDGKMYEIGFDLAGYGFLKTIDLCFDEDERQSIWAHAIIQPSSQDDSRYTKGPSYNFKQGIQFNNVFNVKDSPYIIKLQIAKFKAILKKKDVSDYIEEDRSSTKYLARGHLISKADMLYRSEQESTYFFGNVVPMWQSINANPGNWFKIEKFVRYLALKSKTQFDVYVGWLGALRYEDKKINLFGINEIPVPNLLYKCVIDKSHKRGLCFIVSNDPKLQNNPNDLERLAMFSKQEKSCRTIDPAFNDTKLGYVYCVSIARFYEKTRKYFDIEELQNYVTYDTLAVK